jgi:hypothetical protein
LLALHGVPLGGGGGAGSARSPHWVANVLPETDYLKQGSDGGSMGGYVGSKFEGFIFDPMPRRSSRRSA